MRSGLMKASCRLFRAVELCHLAAVIRKRLPPKKLMPLLFLLGALSTQTPSCFAQAPTPPLNFGNNFFVTGDYIVAGANGMTTNFTTIGGVGVARTALTPPAPHALTTGRQH